MPEHDEPADDRPGNDLLRAARLRLRSPSGAPRHMSRQELAEAVNTYLWHTHRIRDHLNQRQIGELERGVTRWPGRHRREALRAVLGAATDAELGLYTNRRRPTSAQTPDDRTEGDARRADLPEVTDAGPRSSVRPMGLRPAPGATAASSIPTYSHRGLRSGLAKLRAELDEVLAASSVSSSQLDLIEQSAAEHIQVYPATPPAEMLSRLVSECLEVRALSQRRQPAAVQARLSGTAALLATMCADALMRLGEVNEARLWYRTAIHAADDSGENRLRVLARAQATMLPYYYGDPHQSVSMADAALAVPGAPGPSAALAAAGRARALARIGATDAARKAIEQARRLFDEVGDADSDAAFRFPAKRLLFYLSGAHTWLGDTRAAYHIQDDALRLYGPVPAAPIDPALIQLDRSMCLALDRRAAEAAATAQEAIAGLPQAQRTEIVLARARDVVAAVPAVHRRGEMANLADYLQVRGDTTLTMVAGTTALDL